MSSNISSSSEKSLRFKLGSAGIPSRAWTKVRDLEKRVTENQELEQKLEVDLVHLEVHLDRDNYRNLFTCNRYCSDWQAFFGKIAIINPRVLHLQCTSSFCAIPVSILFRAITPTLRSLVLSNVSLEGNTQQIFNTFRNDARALECIQLCEKSCSYASSILRARKLKKVVIQYVTLGDLETHLNDLRDISALESLTLTNVAVSRNHPTDPTDRRRIERILPSLIPSAWWALKTLNFTCGSLHRDTFQSFGDLLLHNKTLKKMALGIISGGIPTELVDAMKTGNRTLRRLTLLVDDNLSDQTCFRGLISMMEVNFSLESLKVNKPAVYDDAWQGGRDAVYLRNDEVDQYLLLNRTGRGKIERGESMEQSEWIEAIIACRSHLESVYYYLGKNPGLLSTCHVDASESESSEDESERNVRQSKRRKTS